MQFSDNQNLTFDQQADELELIVDKVLALNPGKSQVILAAHSMGGLASRTYLQFPFIFSSRGKVLKLITVGTPHLGAPMAEFVQERCDDNAFFLLCNLVKNKWNMDPFSVAMVQLRPDSLFFSTLNDLTIVPLPRDVIYTSLVVTGVNVFGTS